MPEPLHSVQPTDHLCYRSPDIRVGKITGDPAALLLAIHSLVVVHVSQQMRSIYFNPVPREDTQRPIIGIAVSLTDSRYGRGRDPHIGRHELPQV